MTADQRVALVTGAGQGIGVEIARLLAESGAVVAVNDVIPARAEECAAAIQAAGGQAAAAPGDVSQPEGARAIVAEAERRLGPVDVLVNNAGICVRGRTWEFAIEDWDRIIAVNLRGAFLMCRAVVPGMMARGWGRIINISSVAGKMGGLLVSSAYAASKGGALALTKSLAREVAGKGITVNAVCPATVAIGMSDQFTAEEQQWMAKSIPVGRLAEAREIAAAVAFLASDDAAFITGEAMDVNGGLLMD
jgi:3-oxoacyl-[acyl-carrier protein] reductase